MTVEKRGGIITVVKALVSRQDTLEVPLNLFSAKNRHTASSPVLERVSPQGSLWATGQNIKLSRHPCYTADLEKKNPAGWNPLFEG